MANDGTLQAPGSMNAELSFDVPASPDAVFDHFTNPDLLVRWWPTGSETWPEPGGVYHMWWDGPGHHLRGRYLKIDRPSRLSSSWRFDHDDTTSAPWMSQSRRRSPVPG
ncbi:MAG: SRPBCC domain-containing protein [Acidimicrobiia bacterium]